MNRIEAIVDALGRLHGVHNPESPAYLLRNPLLLRSFARTGKHEVDEQGRRVFASHLNGYKAALFDVELKITGRSHAGVQTTDTLRNLLAVYGVRETMAVDHVVSFLRRALKDVGIMPDTPLVYFRAALGNE